MFKRTRRKREAYISCPVEIIICFCWYTAKILLHLQIQVLYCQLKNLAGNPCETEKVSPLHWLNRPMPTSINISEQLPPPWGLAPLGPIPKCGVPLDPAWPPGSKNVPCAPNFQPWSAWEADIPRNQFFGKVVEAKVVQHVKLGWFKVFPDIQDHLGQSQGQWQPGVGQEQGRPQDMIIGQSSWNNGVQHIKLGWFRKILKTSRTIWAKPRAKAARSRSRARMPPGLHFCFKLLKQMLFSM